jgi:hypothetical protein
VAGTRELAKEERDSSDTDLAELDCKALAYKTIYSLRYPVFFLQPLLCEVSPTFSSTIKDFKVFFHFQMAGIYASTGFHSLVTLTTDFQKQSTNAL